MIIFFCLYCSIISLVASLLQSSTIINSKFVKNKPKIVYDLSKKSGDKKRVLITKLAKKNGIINQTSLKDGIDQSILWYLENKKFINKFKYNQFKKKK